MKLTISNSTALSHAGHRRLSDDCVRPIPRCLWDTGLNVRVNGTSVELRMIAYAAGTGSAVTDLIFSIAKREVTFFSGTALISFL